MERLTYFDGGKWRLKIGDTEYSGEVVDRLAAYEDTGLEPKEIIRNGMMFEDNKRYAGRLELKLKAYEKLGPIDHLRKLAQADREKRIIVVPKDNNELFEKLKDLFFSDWAALRREQDG